jgi:hypothetical protein
MMTDTHLGRLLPACLHQAINDVMPSRLDYYEEWLSPDGLRDGNIGLAPVTAVLGFLRTEGEAYHAVLARAGTLAAAWTLASSPSFGRRVGTVLPLRFRAYFGLRVVRRIAADVLARTVASTRLRRGRATLRLNGSVFCTTRGLHARPLCDFYAALAVETLRHFQVAATANIESCRAVDGASQCVVAIDIGGAARQAEPARAA